MGAWSVHCMSKHGEKEEHHGQWCRQGTSEKETAVSVKCAKITELLKQSAARDDDESFEGAGASERSEAVSCKV